MAIKFTINKKECDSFIKKLKELSEVKLENQNQGLKSRSILAEIPPKILINDRFCSPDEIDMKPMSYNPWLQAKIKQIFEDTRIIESVFEKHIQESYQ